MTEDTNSKPSEESFAAANAMRKRKKRKWDEPADLLISPIIAISGTSPVGIGSTNGTPGVFPLSNAIATNTVVPSITQNVVTLVQKLSQPKVQDEPIAREIVINDAEPTIRYKLTKRQTQEEIQKSTGAVVITRGKYRPPNALPDSEKPLYLHISAGSHLKDMAERIIAVDHAAAMVEEILRQGHNLVAVSGPYTAVNSNGQVNQALSICLFPGFEPDPSQNIPARIRGPNDQYINHIINETGATVVLRGKGSGNHDSSHPEEDQQQLHLYLSSTNSKSLEAAKCLAENLLDTISTEIGASRVSSSKVYNAVPPPQQLLAGVQTSANMEAAINPLVSSLCAVSGIAQTAQSFASSGLVVSAASTVSPSGVSIQNGVLPSNGNPIPNVGSYAYPIATRGTCYSGYGGIYPQATPLQQVALALKQAPVSNCVVSSTTSHASTLPKPTSSSAAETERRPPQKRKFQELPVTSKVLPTLNQNLRLGSECFKSGFEDADARKFPSMPLPEKLIKSGLGEQLPPLPPRMMMPPPPPKFSSTQLPSDAHNQNFRVMLPPSPKLPSLQSHSEAWNQNPIIKASIPETSSPTLKSPVSEKPSAEPVSDTLLKLVEYDEEEEEEDAASSADESCRSNLMICTSSKPFWAV